MNPILRISLATAVAGGLSWFLGKIVIDGIRTGSIRHTDSSKVCRRQEHPFGFWCLVALFTGFIVLFIADWILTVSDAIGKMK
jgi:hypothetical protein